MYRENFGSTRSQLNIILDIIGSPNEEDLHHLDPQTANLLRNSVKKAPRVSYKQEFPC
jgi:hypothetical protein